MFVNRSNSNHRRIGASHLQLEFLESRRLLAGDFQAGDANQDYHFDEADWVHMMKPGKFGTGQTADWTGGDFTGNTQFNVTDMVAAFEVGLYKQGPYDEEAGPAVNHLTPLSTTGEPDVTIFYFPDSGNVTAVAPKGMTTLHLVSQSNSFSEVRSSSGLFDVHDTSSRFIFTLKTSIEHPGLLPTGWTEQQLLDDLLVDGSTYQGGDLGNVRLGVPEDFPSELPELPPDNREVLPRLPESDQFDPILKNFNSADPFVTVDEANALMTYDSQTGDIRMEAIETPFMAVELLSADEIFEGTVENARQYTVGLFDVAQLNKFFRLNPNGMTSIDLPGIARTGLSAMELTASIRYKGSMSGGGSIKIALSPVDPVAIVSDCQSRVDGDAIIGDADLDGHFNSRDLVKVFQAGEYDDGIPENSMWAEGDWNCDGDFDSADLVVAFQSGSFESLAAAIAARIVSNSDSKPTMGEVGNVDELPLFDENARPAELHANLTTNGFVSQLELMTPRVTDVTDQAMSDFDTWV